jgi:hypothetical protein
VPDAEEEIWYDSTYKVPRIDIFMETENRIEVTKGMEEEIIGRFCLISTELILEIMKKFQVLLWLNMSSKG